MPARNGGFKVNPWPSVVVVACICATVAVVLVTALGRNLL